MKSGSLPLALAFLAGSALAASAESSTAQDAGMLMTYELFENTVPHADVETCPEEFAGLSVFCRLTIAHDMLNVIVFSTEGDSPMIAVRQVDLDKTELAY